MPINKLVRQSSSFPPLGKLHKGSKKRLNAGGKEIMGTDLKYFRFESQDTDAMTTFQREHGDQPDNIKVYLVHPTPDQAFQFWKEEYRSGNLYHRCDDTTCTLWRKDDGSFSTEPKPCPGNCKEVGRLFIVLPSLRRFAYVTVETHSKNDIMQLQDNLNAAYDRFGDLTRVPFLLSRREREMSYVDKGVAHKVKKSMLYLEPQPEMMDIYLRIAEQSRQKSAGLLPDTRFQTERLLVDKNTGEIFDDEDDFIEGDALASTVSDLYGVSLDGNSQALFIEWMIKRYTNKMTPKDVRSSVDQLTEKEIATLVGALKERTKIYFDDFKKEQVAAAQKADEAAVAKAEAEALQAMAQQPAIEGEIVEGYQVPESELVAA